VRPLRFVLLLICGLGPVWARHPGDPIKPGLNLYSKFIDIQVGQAAALQVRRQYRVVNDAFLQEYIKRCGDRLAATPEARQSGFSFSFTMLNVPQVNAFALPGGPMFIFTGLLNSTENEAQLMGVMAHEMSHVILRHGTHEARRDW
jgi:beta-barrel assembly-enhancing protease